MNRLFIALLMLSTFSSFAQRTPNPVTYANTITAAELRKHLFIVAGAEMEGRETATEGERKAAAYIENEFRRIGLQPSSNGTYRMPFNVYQDTLLRSKLEVNGMAYELDRDYNININNFPATLAFSEVVFIPQSIPADTIKKYNIAGKLIMIPAEGGGQGGRFQMSPRLQAIIAGHPAAVLTVTGTFPRTQPANRKGSQSINLFRRSYNPQQVTISEGVAQSILRADVKQVNTITTAPANVLLQIEKATLTLPSSNVLGVLPGTDKSDEYLFITSHYDHVGKRDTVIYYGADDDGSGTVAVIELAEAFAAARTKGHGPRRTIVFMTVSGEEKGLWGSEMYSNNPLYPLDKTTANLNIDMIGRSDATRKPDTLNYIYVVGDDKLSSELKPISETTNKKYTKLQLDYKFNEPNDPHRIYYRSDHYNFARKGVPIIFYYDGMMGPDYHGPTDTPDKINYELMTRRAKLIFHTAWEMANRDDMLKRDLSLDQSVFNR